MLLEKIGDGDHSSLACIPKEAQGKAKTFSKRFWCNWYVEFAKMVS
jgi:nicotinate-nucleotide pyrophosphorylase (carboxylating)